MLKPDQDAESAQPKRPLVVGRYRLEDDSPIGRGATGEVWRATDTTLNRVVALKQIQLAGVAEHIVEGLKQRTLHEGQTIAALSHPNIVSVYDVVTDGDRIMLVLEYVSSRGADALLAAHGPFPLHLAAQIGAQMAEALAAVHAHGVLHRDITPGNVLIDDRWNATLTDFGISQVTIDLQRTTDVASIGTPAFMAPETARGEPATSATDIYGLGATIWALVEGVPPFHQPGPDNPMRLIRRIATGQLSPPVNAGPLTEVLTSTTSGDPTRRPDATRTRDMFVSAARVIAAQTTEGPTALPALPNVDRLGSPQVDAPSQRPISTKPRGRRRSFALPVAIIASALLLIAIAVGGFILVPGPKHPEAAPPPPPAQSDKYLPNPALADTCAMAKLPDYTSFGKTTYTPDTLFGSCHANINLIGGGTANVNFHMFGPQQVDGPVEQHGDLKIISPPQFDDPTTCYRDLVLPDRNMLVASTIIANSTMNSCAFSSVGIDSAIQQLHTIGSISALPNLGAPNSLRRQDACQLLKAADNAEVPGLDFSKVYPQYANWTCYWGADLNSHTSAPWVSLGFAGMDPMVAGKDGTPQTIGGRTVFVETEPAADTTDSTGDSCGAQIVHMVRAPTGETKPESANVWVHANVPPGQECKLATDLAAKLIPRLPPAG